MKAYDKIFSLFAVILAFVIVFPFAGNFFLAAFSNANVDVPASQGGSIGGSAWYYPTVITLPPTVPLEEKPVPPVVKQPEEITENSTAPVQTLPIIPPVQQPVALPAENVQPAFLKYLPAGISALAQKVPQLSGVFANLDINSAEAASNLGNYNIFAPGLKEITGANFSKLTQEQKNKIPADAVFVLLGDGNIDASAKLDFSNHDDGLLAVNVLPQKLIRLVVKPSSLAQSAVGYVLLKPDSLSGSEEEFSVLKFDYSDNDKDGIYVADISSPAVEGQYQISTSINYGEKTEEIKITTLVDPDGYIYEKMGDKELRINNAVVSLYKLNAKNQYELWTANEYGQENPQITDSTGKYSFLVPEGTYYLSVKAPGYYFYQSDAISVKEGREVHSNISLKREFNFVSFLNFDTISIIILFCFVAFDFYRDWKTKKISTKK